jgi:hypothetical protein
MRALASLLLLWSVPAHAMNWEGHDDWMTDMEPAALYKRAAPHASPRASPLPDGGCPERASKAVNNPYEQIPLGPGNCPERPPDPPGREAER